MKFTVDCHVNHSINVPLAGATEVEVCPQSHLHFACMPPY